MIRKLTKKKLFYSGSVISILGLFLYGFIKVSAELRKNELVHFDNTVIDFVQAYISDELTQLMMIITFLGSVNWITVAVVIGSGILYKLEKYSLSAFLILSSGVGAIFNIVLKTIFQRERPDIRPLIMEQGFSFPSGHSMGSFIFYGALAFVILHFARKKLWGYIGVILMVLMIIMIGLSRVYLGVHFPSDIIGGFTAGGAWLIVCILCYRYYEYKKKLRLS